MFLLSNHCRYCFKESRSSNQKLHEARIHYLNQYVAEEKKIPRRRGANSFSFVTCPPQGPFRKRASDLCLKQKRFQDYADPSNLDYFKEELWPDVERIQQRDEEYALLNMYKK